MSRIINLLIIIFSATAVFAQGPPITTETPIMLGIEGNGIRTFGKFISKENVFNVLFTAKFMLLFFFSIFFVRR